MKTFAHAKKQNKKNNKNQGMTKVEPDNFGHKDSSKRVMLMTCLFC